MLNSSLEKKLSSLLTALRATTDAPVRVAVLGIGNELNGDDAAGVVLARRLAASLPARENLLVVEAGLAPENFTGPLRRFRPHLVILADAGEVGAQPGEAALFDGQEAAGFSASTHTLPPSILAGYLQSELNCAVAILAIQAAQTNFDAPLSPAVEQGVQLLAGDLLNILENQT